jgi:hypothetical protein
VADEPPVTGVTDTIEKLRNLAGEVDRAVSVAARVREEVEPAISAVIYPPVGPVGHEK